MKKCILLAGIVLASTALQAQPLVVYTADQLDPASDRYCPYCAFKVHEAERKAREHGTSQPLVIYTADQLDPASDRYCPYCAFKVHEAERKAREHGTSQPLVIYTADQLDPASDRYCPYCAFKVHEAERKAREREIKDAAKEALRRFDDLRERRNRD